MTKFCFYGRWQRTMLLNFSSSRIWKYIWMHPNWRFFVNFDEKTIRLRLFTEQATTFLFCSSVWDNEQKLERSVLNSNQYFECERRTTRQSWIMRTKRRCKLQTENFSKCLRLDFFLSSWWRTKMTGSPNITFLRMRFWTHLLSSFVGTLVCQSHLLQMNEWCSSGIFSLLIKSFTFFDEWWWDNYLHGPSKYAWNIRTSHSNAFFHAFQDRFTVSGVCIFETRK